MAVRAIILAFAGAVDALEFALVWAMTALGATAAGAVGGCAAGYQVAGEVGCKVGAALGGLVGFLAQSTGGGAAVGFMLGYIMSVCISLSAGAMLVMLLIFINKGLKRPALTGYVFLSKMLPLIGTAPSWTYYAWKCTGLPKTMGPTEKYSRASLLLQQTYNRSVFADIRPANIAAKTATGMLVLVLLFGGETAAYAQTLPPPIQYVVTPEAPGPNQQVTIEAQGVGSFLGSAELAWTQDGKVVLDGIGERKYTFTTGPLGQKTTVRVAIDSSQGAFAQTFVFNPSLINLVWEADTTTPTLYKGKALYSAGSDYKVVALPSVYSGGSKVSESALSFQWSRAGDAIPEQSGLGRFVLSMTGDQLQASENVAVDVYYGNALAGRGGVVLPASAPRIILYPRDALRGALYDTAIPAAISLIGKEITVQAEPYYFSNKAKNSGALPYVWTLNDNETAGPDSSRGILTLRQTGSGTGAATIGVSVQNSIADQFVQNASASLQLVFGAQTGTSLLNFFGL